MSRVRLTTASFRHQHQSSGHTQILGLGGKRDCAQNPLSTCIPCLISADIPMHPMSNSGGDNLSKSGFQRPSGASGFLSFGFGHPNSLSLELSRNEEPSVPRQLWKSLQCLAVLLKTPDYPWTVALGGMASCAWSHSELLWKVSVRSPRGDSGTGKL